MLCLHVGYNCANISASTSIAEVAWNGNNFSWLILSMNSSIIYCVNFNSFLIKKICKISSNPLLFMIRMINYILQQFLFKWGFKYIINSVYDSSRSRSSQRLWSLHMLKVLILLANLYGYIIKRFTMVPIFLLLNMMDIKRTLPLWSREKS